MRGVVWYRGCGLCSASLRASTMIITVGFIYDMVDLIYGTANFTVSRLYTNISAEYFCLRYDIAYGTCLPKFLRMLRWDVSYVFLVRNMVSDLPIATWQTSGYGSTVLMITDLWYCNRNNAASQSESLSNGAALPQSKPFHQIPEYPSIDMLEIQGKLNIAQGSRDPRRLLSIFLRTPNFQELYSAENLCCACAALHVPFASSMSYGHQPSARSKY